MKRRMSLVLAQLKRYLAGEDMQVSIIFYITGVEVRIAKEIPNNLFISFA